MHSCEWQSVRGYEGVYQVSCCGQILRTGKAKGARRGQTLKQFSNGHYLMVDLSRDNKAETRLVHELVASAFIGTRPSGWHVNHKNLDKNNNRVANLEYVTAKENVHHAIRNGHRARITHDERGRFVKEL